MHFSEGGGTVTISHVKITFEETYDIQELKRRLAHFGMKARILENERTIYYNEPEETAKDILEIVEETPGAKTIEIHNETY